MKSIKEGSSPNGKKIIIWLDHEMINKNTLFSVYYLSYGNARYRYNSLILAEIDFENLENGLNMIY